MDNIQIERKLLAILRVLKNASVPVGAVVIARELQYEGIKLDGRTVRYHLKIMDERGLTKKHGREGRTITPEGLKELNDSLVFDRVGYINSKIESLSYQVTFDPDTRDGKVIINTAFIPLNQLDSALKIMNSILNSNIGLSRLAVLYDEGAQIGDATVPEGMAGIGTVCSILINGVLIKHGIPVEALFGVSIEMEDLKPRRFTELIHYSGSSTDPLELFLRGGYTSVLKCSKNGSGKVLANFREIPAAALRATEDILIKLKKAGFTGTLETGRPGQPVFGVSTTANRCGIAVMGGLNAFAACREAGLDMSVRAISNLLEFEELIPVAKLKL